MDINNIRFFIENQLKEAEGAGDPASVCEQLLLIADRMLELADADSPLSDEQDAAKLKRLVLRCSSIARRSVAYAGKWGGSVRQGAAKALTAIEENSRLTQELEAEAEKAEAARERAAQSAGKLAEQQRELQEKNRGILEAETDLRRREEEFNALRMRLDELGKILETATDSALQDLRDKISAIETNALSRQEALVSLTAEWDKAREQCDSLEARIRDLQEVQLPERRKELAELEGEGSRAEAQSRELSERILAARDARADLDALLEINGRIAASLRRDGFLSDDENTDGSFTHRLEDIRQRGEAVCAEYDSLLHNVIADAEEFQKRLKGRQDPNYR